MFNQDQKSVLIKLLGEANFLSASVLNGLAHENLQSLTFVGKKCNKGALFTLSYLSKVYSLFVWLITFNVNQICVFSIQSWNISISLKILWYQKVISCITFNTRMNHFNVLFHVIPLFRSYRVVFFFAFVDSVRDIQLLSCGWQCAEVFSQLLTAQNS